MQNTEGIFFVTSEDIMSSISSPQLITRADIDYRGLDHLNDPGHQNFK